MSDTLGEFGGCALLAVGGYLFFGWMAQPAKDAPCRDRRFWLADELFHSDAKPICRDLIGTNSRDIIALRNVTVEMRKQIDDLSKSDATTKAITKYLAEDHQSLVKTFNRNVEIDNAKARKDEAAERTRRGMCGTEVVQGPYGVVNYRNRECPIIPDK